MKIFLNDRTIQFVKFAPDNPLPTDMIVIYESVEKLQEAYADFQRYEKFLILWIIGQESAFQAFISFLKYIPAAGGLVKNEKGEYLFIHRLGHWDLPKGKIDKKDIQGKGSLKKQSPLLTYDDATLKPHPSWARNAAIREVKEETGLKTVKIVKDLPSTWHTYTVKDKQILKQTMWFEMEADSAQTLKPQTSEGIFLVKWTNPNAIHCILSHTYASLRELLLEVFF